MITFGKYLLGEGVEKDPEKIKELFGKIKEGDFFKAFMQNWEFWQVVKKSGTSQIMVKKVENTGDKPHKNKFEPGREEKGKVKFDERGTAFLKFTKKGYSVSMKVA